MADECKDRVQFLWGFLDKLCIYISALKMTSLEGKNKFLMYVGKYTK